MRQEGTGNHLRLLRKNQLGLQSMNFSSNMKKNEVRKKTDNKEGGREERKDGKERRREGRKIEKKESR